MRPKWKTTLANLNTFQMEMGRGMKERLPEDQEIIVGVQEFGLQEAARLQHHGVARKESPRDGAAGAHGCPARRGGGVLQGWHVVQVLRGQGRRCCQR